MKLKILPFLPLLLSSILLYANDTTYIASGALIKYNHIDAGIYCIIQAQNGDIWVGTQNGVWRYDQNEWFHYTTSDGLGDNYVNTIYEDSSGKIWVGTSNKDGLNYYENSTWTNFKAGGAVPAYVYSICQGSDGLYYISGRTQSGHDDMFTFDGINFTQLFLSGEQFRNIYKSSDNSLYVGAYSSLLNHNSSGWGYRFVGYCSLFEMTETSENKLMITSSIGFHELSNSGIKTYTYSNTQGGLLSDQCYAVINYNQNLIWVGTSAGICSFNGNTWNNLNDINTSLSTPWIEALLKDKEGNIWIADRNNALYTFYPGYVKADIVSASVLSGNSYCTGDEIEYQVEVRSFFKRDNSFVLQFSDTLGNFVNGINVLSVNTNSSVRLIEVIPSSIKYEKPYLVRIKSTKPQLFSDIETIVIHQTPTSAFTVTKQELCSYDTLNVAYSGANLQDATFSWFFDNANMISEDGNEQYKIKWNTQGIKNIKLSVTKDGCTSDINSTSIKVKKQPSSTFTLDNIVCENENAYLHYTGNASDTAIFDWDFDSGNIVSGNESGPYTLNWENFGTYRISLTVYDNGCFSSVYSKPIDYNPRPTAIINVSKSICYSSTASILYAGSASNSAEFDWNFNGGSIISGSGPGPFEITWPQSGLKTIQLNVIENGCSSNTSADLTVKDQTQPINICMVGVDSLNQNIVTWEHLTNTDYDSILIYKEISQLNIYKKIGIHPAEYASIFIDTLTNPSEGPSRYKISLLDSCGYETPKSDYHKTIHLSINSGSITSFTLTWDQYEGFDYNTYDIFRGTSMNNLIKIAELANNSQSYDDLSPLVGTSYYMIKVANPNACIISNTGTSDDFYKTSRSNIVRANYITSTNDYLSDNTIVWPNPADDKLYISSHIDINNTEILILSLDGKVLIEKHDKQLENEIDISYLSSGMYIISFKNNEEIKTLKFLKR